MTARTQFLIGIVITVALSVADILSVQRILKKYLLKLGLIVRCFLSFNGKYNRYLFIAAADDKPVFSFFQRKAA